MMKRPRIAFVVAMDDNRLIGRDNDLPWRLPDDMRWFRDHTMGKPCIMGRKTYDSLPARFRPLPGRLNIVVTRNPDYQAPGAVVVGSIDAALRAAGEVEEIIVVGGAALFRELMPVVDRLYLTRVRGAVEGDVYFPDFDVAAWRETYREEHPADDRHAYPFTWLILARSAANNPGAVEQIKDHVHEDEIN
ncbi:MAG: dihydrofolate reductase [Anaerolineae bacterium]|nr:MAG: dihydrofolate reductase [Anaerolineae bacterium]